MDASMHEFGITSMCIGIWWCWKAFKGILKIFESIWKYLMLFWYVLLVKICFRISYHMDHYQYVNTSMSTHQHLLKPCPLGVYLTPCHLGSIFDIMHRYIDVGLCEPWWAMWALMCLRTCINMRVYQYINTYSNRVNAVTSVYIGSWWCLKASKSILQTFGSVSFGEYIWHHA